MSGACLASTKLVEETKDLNLGRNILLQAEVKHPEDFGRELDLSQPAALLHWIKAPLYHQPHHHDQEVPVCQDAVPWLTKHLKMMMNVAS